MLRVAYCGRPRQSSATQGCGPDSVQGLCTKAKVTCPGSRGLCDPVQLRNLDCELAGDADCWLHPGLASQELWDTSVPATRGTWPELALGARVRGDLPGAGQPIARVAFTALVTLSSTLI